MSIPFYGFLFSIIVFFSVTFEFRFFKKPFAMLFLSYGMYFLPFSCFFIKNVLYYC